MQLWHGGRTCHPLLNNGEIPIAPSSIPITSDKIHIPQGKVSHVIPRALEDEEIPMIVAKFQSAAENAKIAGFDGLEIHGSNSYLLDEFLRDSSNQRSGAYGGSVENRSRLMLEVLEATISVWGSDRAGLRLSPFNTRNSMNDSDPFGTFTWLATRLNNYNLAYLHITRAGYLGE